MSYIRVGSRVLYRKDRYNDKEPPAEGTVVDIKARTSIGFTSHVIVIKPSDGKGVVTRTTGGRYGDWVALKQGDSDET